MRKRGKKIFFNKRDTFDLDYTLSPIIGSALIKFKEVVFSEDNPWKGVPCCIADCKEEFVDNGLKEWERRVDCMIYAFTAEEPEIGFRFEHIELPKEEGSVLIPFSLVCLDEEASDRYDEALILHEAKRKEGLGYFSNHYQDLWW